MCSYNTLYYDDKNGYVIFCSQCQKIQLGFGCVMIDFDREEFRAFKTMINEASEQFAYVGERISKTVTIPTPSYKLSLFLSPLEINILAKMLEEADTNLQVKDMLNMF